ncbi:MAG: preprotein translocase subunit SecG [Oscillospiraceae bacterium]
MGIVEIIGGVLLLVLCVVIIVAVTLIESKSGLGAIAGESSGTFFDRNRGKTKEAMLVRATSISGAALVLLTMVVLFVSMR